MVLGLDGLGRSVSVIAIFRQLTALFYGATFNRAPWDGGGCLYQAFAPMREPGFSQSVRVSLHGSLGWTTS